MKLITTVIFLILSLITNVYLYLEVDRLKDAWLNQFITTSDIEAILKSSTIDLSFENIKYLSISYFGKESVHIVNLEDEFTEYSADRIALSVNDTFLFFKDGLYYGSKAKLLR